MLKIIALSAAIGITAAGCAVQAGALSSSATTASAPEAAMAAPLCRLDAKPVRGGVKLTASVDGPAPFLGSYTLHIKSTGPGGSSDISQGGDVDFAGGPALMLGEAEVASGKGMAVEAVLTLTDPAGAVICTDAYPAAADL